MRRARQSPRPALPQLQAVVYWRRVTWMSPGTHFEVTFWLGTRGLAAGSLNADVTKPTWGSNGRSACSSMKPKMTEADLEDSHIGSATDPDHGGAGPSAAPQSGIEHARFLADPGFEGSLRAALPHPGSPHRHGDRGSCSASRGRGSRDARWLAARASAGRVRPLGGFSGVQSRSEENQVLRASQSAAQVAPPRRRLGARRLGAK